MKTPLFACCVTLFFISSSLFAQIRVDFEDRDFVGFQLEGLQEEGNLSLAENTGNPGNCLRIDKGSPELPQLLTLSRAFYGRWAATKIDSIFFDVWVHQESGTPIDDFPWVLEISGPGGTAVALANQVFPTDTWQHVAVALDPFFWDIQRGSWAEITQYVDQVRIRANYIDGGEYVLIDNPGLTFTPQTDGPRLAVCSSFENYGFEGWQFKQTSGIEKDEQSGNPNGTVRVGDRLSEVSKGYAPSKFLGDWRALEENGYLQLDLRINTISGLFLYDKPFFLYILGPGGQAFYPADRDEIREALNEWHTFRFPIKKENWVMAEGTWEELVQDIHFLEIDLEFITTPETVLLDNICMQNPQATSNPVAFRGSAADFDIFPNPSTADLSIHVLTPQPLTGIVTLTDVAGRICYRRSFQSRGKESFSLPVRHLTRGTYWVHINAQGKKYSKKVVLGR